MPFRLAGLAFALAVSVVLGPGYSDEQPKPAVPVTGKADAKFAKFDELMANFVEKYKIPGGALAAGYQGKLVYSRGFGYADLEKRQPVQPDALFRLSSASKPLTAVAVMRLVEEGKIKLDGRVMKLLGLKAPAKDFDERWEKITVENLLENRSGWNHRDNDDPMFFTPQIAREMRVPSPASPNAIIRFMLRRKLHYEPGEYFGYSNFGYCLLGRVIEKASKQKYEAYVKKNVLEPLGITKARLGRTLLANRAPGEVKYYSPKKSPAVMGPMVGKQVSNPYGAWCMESMDASSGWIASAPDMVRFVGAFGDPKSCKLLDSKTVETMFAAPKAMKGKPYYYAKGWLVRIDGGKRSYWHDGSTDGSSIMMLHRLDGLTMAIFFNTREKAETTDPVGDIQAPLLTAATEILAKP